jgi:hypothetical protein
VPSEQGVKMTVPLEVYAKDKEHVTVRLLVSEGMEGAKVHRQVTK